MKLCLEMKCVVFVKVEFLFQILSMKLRQQYKSILKIIAWYYLDHYVHIQLACCTKRLAGIVQNYGL